MRKTREAQGFPSTPQENIMKFTDLTKTTTTEDKLIVIMPGGEKLIIEAQKLDEVLEEIVNSNYLISEEAEIMNEYLEELSSRISEDPYELIQSGVKQELRTLEDELDFELFWVEDDFYEKGINSSSPEERHYFSRVTSSQSEKELW